MEGPGYFELPRRPFAMDLGRARAALESRGIPVTDARVMLIVATRPELTLSRNGRILIKTRDPGEAERAVDHILEALGLPALAHRG